MLRLVLLLLLKASQPPACPQPVLCPACGRGEVWSLDVDPTETRLATASTDVELQLYEIQAGAAGEAGGDSGGGSSRGGDFLVPMGSVRRQSTERAQTLRYFFPPGGVAAAEGSAGGLGAQVLLTCQSAGKVVEVYRVRGEAEARRKLKRRLKRRREKQQQQQQQQQRGSGGGKGGGEGAEGAEDEGGRPAAVGGAAEGEQLAASDELELVAALRSKHKVRSFAYVPAAAPGGRAVRQRGAMQLVLALANNSLEVWEVGPGAAAEARASGEGEGAGGSSSYKAEKVQTVDGGGHRSDVRAVALSSDDSMCLSGGWVAGSGGVGRSCRVGRARGW